MPIGKLAKLRERLVSDERADPDLTNPTLLRLIVPARLRRRSGRTVLIGAKENARRPDAVLVNALRFAHAMVHRDRSGLPLIEGNPASPYHRRLIRLAFLSPDLQRAILERRQPPDLNLARLMGCRIPLSWAEQECQFGFKPTD